MKKSLIGLLTWFGIIGVLPLSAAEPPITEKPPVRILLTVDRDKVLLGGELRPSIVVSNETMSSVTILNPDYAIQSGDLSITITGPDGEKLKLSMYPPAPLSPKPKDYGKIGSGEQLKWIFPDLVERYAISKAGKYELQVRYRVEVSGKGVVAESQKLTVEFFQPEKKSGGE